MQRSIRDRERFMGHRCRVCFLRNTVGEGRMKEIKAEIEIAAGAGHVWEILTDFPSYAEWNPFLLSISGDVHVGSRFEARIRPPGAREMCFKPRLLEFEPGHRMRWLGNFLVPGLVDGEHTLAIQEISNDRVRFSQHERFTGLLVPLISKTLAATVRGFEAMNLALKQRAES